MHNIELLVIREVKKNGIAICLKPSTPFVLTPSMAHEIRNTQNSLVDQYLTRPWEGLFFVIWYLNSSEQVAWRGLDFKFIVKCLKRKQEAKFEHYIQEVFNLLFLNHIGLGLPLINCSIINRKVVGISQEFFLLNQINFLKLYDDPKFEQITPIDYKMHFPKCAFPEEYYSKNQLFGFNIINIHEIRTILSQAEFNPPSVDQIQTKQAVFEKIKQETISSIYRLAKKNIKAMIRLSEYQSRALPATFQNQLFGERKTG